jgi:SAM-dependent MidA family methyltransferase
LLLAVEWLDVVPVDVVELAEDGPRLVEVDNSGEERLGGPVDDEQRGWLDRWWPLAEVGDRAEVGLPRDRAWRGLVDRMAAGVAVAVDYAAVPALHLAGTLTGYRDGRQVPPVPDGSCDITAHVLVESCAGGSAEVLTQRQALHRLGLRGRVPAYSGDPRRHLDDLARASAAAELLDPAGLGGFAWLVEPVGGGRLWPQEPVGDSPT